jgi:demethylmenaquinone methyltransferase/2-methoxy-6-polyprenyl-1,4-benzoquinol methylase
MQTSSTPVSPRPSKLDSLVFEYYDRRAAEYDQWYMGTGLFADRDRPGWDDERDALCEAVAALPPRSTLDVACGTGFLTRNLRGSVTGLDQSKQMLAIARERRPDGRFVTGDALALPFADGAFDRVLTGHFYGHLEIDDRARFLAEARRVAPELVVIDSHLQSGHEAEEWQQRQLNDGSVHTIYKRYFTGAGLADELGGGEVLLDGRWFVAVRTDTIAP